MLFLMQLIKMLTKKEIKKFIAVFELIEQGWEGNEIELVNDLLLEHFGISFEDDNQLEAVTEWILKNQGNIKGKITAVARMVGKNM